MRMTIDIRPLLNGETNEIKLDFPLSVDEGIRDVSFPESIEVSGSVNNKAGYVTLDLCANVPYRTRCARCFREINGTKTVEFSKPVADEKTLQNNENDDYVVPVEGMIDVSEMLIEQILLDFPYRHLCKEDCKGLCPKCGKDLNEGSCGCPADDPDPRFDVLRKLLEDKQNKN